jgi:membrane dipeptidase
MRGQPVRLRTCLTVAALSLALSGPAVVEAQGNRRAAREVHMSAVVVDLHCDTILEIHSGQRRFDRRSTRGHIDLPRLREGGVDVQVFAIYVPPKMGSRGPDRARELIRTFKKTITAHAAQITHVTTVEGIERAQRDGKVAAVLSIENGDALGGDVRLLDEFYGQGVRMLGLTWNPSNPLGDGALGRQHGGLTDLGRAALRRMEELGIVPDASHLSEASFWHMMNATRGPVIASHSNAAGLHPHPRNLSDEQLRAIANRGGVVGINFYPGFLGAGTLARVLDHIDYMVKAMGIDHVAVGSDFDGIPQAPSGLEDASKMPNLTAGLHARGYTPEQIRKILGGNALRVFRRVWKK